MSLTLPTTRYLPQYGSIIRFAPAGETIETVVVSRSDKPAGSVFTDWEEIGCVKEASVAVAAEAGEQVECFNATTGQWEILETPDTNALTRLDLEITFQQVTPFVLQMAMAAASINGTTGAYEPASQPGGAWQGWLKCQTQRGTELISVLDLWCEIKLMEPAIIARKAQGYLPKIKVTGLGAAGDVGAFGTAS